MVLESRQIQPGRTLGVTNPLTWFTSYRIGLRIDTRRYMGPEKDDEFGLGIDGNTSEVQFLLRVEGRRRVQSCSRETSEALRLVVGNSCIRSPASRTLP